MLIASVPGKTRALDSLVNRKLSVGTADYVHVRKLGVYPGRHTIWLYAIFKSPVHKVPKVACMWSQAG